MIKNTKRLIQACLGLIQFFLLSGCDRSGEDRLIDGEQMTSEGITIVGSGSDEHLSDYDPEFIDAFNAALSREDYVLAEALATELVSKRNNDANALVGLGLPQLLQGKFKDAAANFDKAIEIEPSNSTALYNRGFAAWQLGDPEAAMHFYGLALEFAPDLPDAHFGMAAASEKLGMNGGFLVLANN